MLRPRLCLAVLGFDAAMCLFVCSLILCMADMSLKKKTGIMLVQYSTLMANPKTLISGFQVEEPLVFGIMVGEEENTSL